MKPPVVNTRAQILAAGLRIADRAGPAAITMRAVADEVGFTATALYRHVRDRNDLLAGIVEQLLDDLPDIRDLPGSWTERLEARFQDLRALGHEHRTVVPLVVHHDRRSPAMQRIELGSLWAFVEAGIPDDRLSRAHAMVWTLQLGFVVREALGHFRGRRPGSADLDAAAASALVRNYVTWAAARPDLAFPDEPSVVWSWDRGDDGEAYAPA